MYGYVRGNAGIRLFLISRFYGQDAASTATEILVAFGMNVKNENGLVDQLSERTRVAFVQGIPTFLYTKRRLELPFLTPPKKFESNTYAASYYIHTEGRAQPVYVRKTRLIDWTVDAARMIHDRRQKPQDREAVLYHLFEAAQLVARRKGLIEW